MWFFALCTQDDGIYSCSCAFGFTELKCFEDVDLCLPNSCPASRIDSIMHFICVFDCLFFLQEEKGISGGVTIYASVYTSVWCHDILVTAPELWEGSMGFYKSISQFLTGATRCHSTRNMQEEFLSKSILMFMSVS